MADRGGSRGTGPAPRAGAGPTVIAAAFVVLVIGLGWLNHSGEVGSDTTPLARDVSRAIETETSTTIPASEPATPTPLGSTGDGGRGGASSTTAVTDPDTGLETTVTAPSTSGSTGSSTTGGSSTSRGGSGTTGTTRGSGTTGTSHPPTTSDPDPDPPDPDPDPPDPDPPDPDPDPPDPDPDPPDPDPPDPDPDPSTGDEDSLAGLGGLLGRLR